jgi:uncharacterized protein YbjT (DUF2867 family)
MKAFVAGATGETGRRIVQALVNQGFAVKALVRDIDRAKALLPEGVDLVVGDVLDRKGLEAAMTGCEVVLSATGARPSFDPTGPYLVDFEGNKNLVDVAKAAGIGHFVMVSSLCVSKNFHPLNLFWLVLVWKKQAEQYLECSGLVYTIVRPGGLSNDDARSDGVVMQGADQLFEGSLPRLKVAQVCVAALGTEAARNKIVEIVARPEAPQVAMAELFAGVG